LETNIPQGPSPVKTFVAPRDSTTGLTARTSGFPNPERRSPPISYADVEDLGNFDQPVTINK